MHNEVGTCAEILPNNPLAKIKCSVLLKKIGENELLRCD